MDTQLTQEDKARIFAMYLGSDYELEYVSVTSGDKVVRHSNLSIFELYSHSPDKWGDIYTMRVHLYDLSDIKLEDVIEILKIDFQMPELPADVTNIQIHRERPRITYTWRGVNSQIELSWNMIYPYADKLRELRYMIPYKGINLFDAGIAIRKTKTT